MLEQIVRNPSLLQGAIEVRDGRVWALLPHHDDTTLGIPPELFEMTAAETRLRATLREVRWSGPGEMELTIFAAIDFVDLQDFPRVECALVDRESRRPAEMPPHEPLSVRPFAFIASMCGGGSSSSHGTLSATRASRSSSVSTSPSTAAPRPCPSAPARSW